MRKKRLVLVSGSALVLGLLTVVLLGGDAKKSTCEKDLFMPGVESIRNSWEVLPNDVGGALTLKEAEQSTAWTPWNHEDGLMQRSEVPCVWYRARIPDRHYAYPALFFDEGVFGDFQVYVNGNEVFRSQEYSPFISRYLFVKWHLISLPETCGGKYLYLKIQAPLHSFLGLYPELSLYGSEYALIIYLLRQSVPILFIGVFLTFAGICSGVLARRRHRSTYFALSMSGMMFCYGLYMMCDSGLIQLYVANPAVIWYVLMTAFMLFPVGLWRYVERLMGAGFGKIIRRFWQVHLLMTLLTVVIDLLGQHVAMLYIFMGVTVALCLENTVVLCLVAKNLKTAKPTFRWLLIGMLILNVSGILEVLDVLGKIGPLTQFWVFREVFSLGLLCFVGILIYIQDRLFRESERKLEATAAALSRYSEQLEVLVDERTSELQTAKEKAEAADRAKSDFLAHMSHELRTPLHAILGYAQLFRKDRTLSDEQRSQVDVVYESGELLLGMINDVLDLSRIEAGAMTLNARCVELRTLLQQIDGMIRCKAEAKGLQLICEVQDTLPARIECDSKRLKQVLLNILNNAVKYTETGMIRWSTKLKEQGENHLPVALSCGRFRGGDCSRRFGNNL